MDGLLDVQLMWISAIVGAGILNGLLFSRRLLTSGFATLRKSHHLPSGAFIFCASMACISMTFLPKAAGYPMEVFFTFAAAPLLLWTVCTYCQEKVSVKMILLSFTLSIACLYWTTHQSWLNISIYNQWIFTLFAWLVFANSIRLKRRTKFKTSLGILAMMTVIHVIQALRIFEFSGEGLPGLIIPIIIAVSLLLISQSSEWMKHLLQLRKRNPKTGHNESQILEDINACVIEPKLFLDPKLNLKAIADKINVPVPSNLGSG